MTGRLSTGMPSTQQRIAGFSPGGGLHIVPKARYLVIAVPLLRLEAECGDLAPIVGDTTFFVLTVVYSLPKS